MSSVRPKLLFHGPANPLDSQALEEPLVRTMVEVLPLRTAKAEQEGEDGQPQYLDSDLGHLFKRRAQTNPRMKALLEKHGTVSARELLDEARDLMRDIAGG